MTLIKYVYPLLVWSFAAYLVFSKLQPRHYDKALELLILMPWQTIFLPVAFFGEIRLFGLVLEIDKAKLHKNELLIGNGVTIVCPIVSTFLMGLLKIDEKIMHYIQFTLLGFALVFFYSPNIFFSSHYHLPAPFQKIHKLLLVTHGAMIYFLVENYRAETAGICFMQSVMWILSFVAIHEFSSVYWSDLRLREDFLNWDYEEEQDTLATWADHDFPVVEQDPEIQNDDRNKEEQDRFRLMKIPRYLEALVERLWNKKQLEKTPSGCECKICLVEYNTTRIPRILRGCGHTICEECAGQLLKNGTKFNTYNIASTSIRCPFCRKITVVQGTVQKMPKNYELMEVIGI